MTEQPVVSKMQRAIILLREKHLAAVSTARVQGAARP
jgi:hypothetical protein